jgi:hypothetical protein
VGVDNPTRASSQSANHSGRLANDGNPATFWEASADDTNAWLRVDLEKLVTVTQTKLTFPSSGNWHYKIDLSANGSSDWKLVTDQTQTTSDSVQREDRAANTEARGRFLRVTIVQPPDGKPASLAELEVQAKLSSP